MNVDARVAALIAGTSARTIRRWVSDGTLTNHGTPQRIRVSLAEVETARTRRALHKGLLLDKMSITVR